MPSVWKVSSMINCFFCQSLIDQHRDATFSGCAYLCLTCSNIGSEIVGWKITSVSNYSPIEKNGDIIKAMCKAHCPQCKGFHQ